MKPYKMNKPPQHGTLIVWEDQQGRHEETVTYVFKAAKKDHTTGAYHLTGAWKVMLTNGNTISQATTQWGNRQPRPADWVRCGPEWRPADWPDRFPLLESAEEAKTAYLKRIGDMEGVSLLDKDVLAAIYENRKAETVEATARAEAKKAQLAHAGQANQVAQLQRVLAAIQG